MLDVNPLEEMLKHIEEVLKQNKKNAFSTQLVIYMTNALGMFCSCMGIYAFMHDDISGAVTNIALVLLQLYLLNKLNKTKRLSLDNKLMLEDAIKRIKQQIAAYKEITKDISKD